MQSRCSHVWLLTERASGLKEKSHIRFLSSLANEHMATVSENTAICCQKRGVTSELLLGNRFSTSEKKNISETVS